MTTYKNAKITSTMLGVEDHGIMTAMLYVDYGGTSQGIGGYALDKPDRDGSKHRGRTGTAYGLNWIMHAMRAIGVQKWEDVKGRPCRVIVDGDDWGAKVLGIAGMEYDRTPDFVFADLGLGDE